MSAPRLEVRLDRIARNARTLQVRLGRRGVAITAITKATLGSPSIARALLAGGVAGLGDARVANVARLRRAGITAPVTLIRSPMPSEAAIVVSSCDVSLNTEATVLDALSGAATAAGRAHGVVLMVELGDLREGVLPDDLVGLARHARDLPGLVLRGIGTNLACRSGVVPDADNMARLSALAADVEDELGVHLSTVSGGNSANLRWALGGGDLGRVDDLRLGEAILLGVDPLDRQPIAGLHQDAFSLVAEVIESKRKPTVAWGQRAQTAFAEHPAERAPGTVAQSILAVGRQDVDPLDLEPPPGATIAASSSDHLVVETEELLAPGTELAFRPGYAALLRAATSPFVHVVGAGRSARPPA